MSSAIKYRFTLYLAENAGDSDLLEPLQEALGSSLEEGTWELEVINVLDVPGKALANDVFATPTILRELPDPVVKLLVNARNIDDILLAVVNTGNMRGEIL